MTIPEVNKLLALMQVNYSYAFKNMSKQDKILLLKTWTFALQDIDASVVFIAVMQLISTSKWPPTVAEIRKKCKQLYYKASMKERSIFFDELSANEKAAYRAIAEKTSHIVDEIQAELSLDAILRNPDMAAIASGRQGIELLDSANSEAWKEDASDGGWEERTMNE